VTFADDILEGQGAFSKAGRHSGQHRYWRLMAIGRLQSVAGQSAAAEQRGAEGLRCARRRARRADHQSRPVFDNPDWDFRTLNFDSDVRLVDQEFASIMNATSRGSGAIPKARS
jgi:hypothetical protein